MGGRIIRGALVGAVLGVLIGVALSGAMYLFNYMRGTIDGDEPQGMVARVESQSEIIAPALNVNGNISRDYDKGLLVDTLKAEGITGLSKASASRQYDALATTKSGEGYGAYQEAENTEEAMDNMAEGDGLANNLLRFHVRANSNTDVDIALKYMVRDAVIAGLEDGLKVCETIEEAEKYLTDSLPLVKELSEEVLSQEGYNYAVKAYLTNDYFPMRQYGDMVLPAGFYQALRVDIGLANGENFWCLLYPTMCVPLDAGGVITKEGQQELKEELTPEQFENLFVKKNVPEENIEIRFKLWDLLT